MAVLRNIRWLSLHIAVGAICVLGLVDHLQGLEIGLAVYAALFHGVWFIYLWDHWRDIHREVLVNPRRLFHQRVKAWIRGLLIVNLCLGAAWACFLPAEVLIAGLGLCVVCAVYFFGIHQFGRANLKEPLSAILYAAGIFLAPLVSGDLENNLIMAGQLALLAFANLTLFSLYEVDFDRKEGFSSIASNVGEVVAERIIALALIALTSSVVFTYTWVGISLKYEVFIFAATVITAVIFGARRHFQVNERYRVVGDVLFIALPLILAI